MPEDRKGSLYLSKDRRYLTDQAGGLLFIKCDIKGRIFYQPIGIESHAYEKVCTETAFLKVCVQWEDGYKCRVWGDVDVCTNWELVSLGYADIS